MKRIIVLAFMVILASGSVFGASKTDKASDKIPQLAILDVMSDVYDKAKSRALTDIIRTELFKLRIFKIVERGVIEKIVQEHNLNLGGLVNDADLLKIGQFLAVEKLFVATMGKFSSTLTLNIRIIDVNTTLIDFTDNVFITDEKFIAESIKDILKKVELNYSVGTLTDPADRKQADRRKWILLGATAEQAKDLLDTNRDPADYLEIRQYDISFKIDDYIETIKAGWESKDVKQFLQYGIPYPSIKRALNYGIVDLFNYRTYFVPKGLTFEDYLDAYANHIVSADEYLLFKQGYRQDRFLLGAGGVADSLPLGKAKFKFFLLQAGWEHFWTVYQRNIFKSSTEAGTYLMQGIIPIPYIQQNFYLGYYPFYFLLGVGAHAEVVLGGHWGVYVRPGIEILEQFQFSVNIIFLGGQPNVSYTDLNSRPGDPGYVPIGFPYFTAEFTYKF